MAVTMFRRLTNSFVSLLLCSVAVCAADRKVAITIDDLPRGGDGGPRSFANIAAMTAQLLRPFRKGKIPVVGFVNQGRGSAFSPAEFRQILDLWLDAGAELGNHSRSHFNIDEVSLREYTEDIVNGEPALRAALAARGKKIEFYRHPFLHLGSTPEIKKGLQTFLDKRGYRVAPVTLDNSDWAFAALYTKPEYRDRVRREYIQYMESVVSFFEQRSVEVVGREFPQILLIHANQLNADMMPDLLAMFRRRGYTFVSLEYALADPAYKLPDGYVGPKGLSWIHRWAMAKGIPERDEPDPPAWVTQGIVRR
jgi:peptidoglycan/xylan/chitin deacetylase (PgdA/CDA1 family)